MEWKSPLPIIFIFIVLCSATTAEAKWCTHTKSENIQHEVTVTEKCNKTYEDSCSFFSWDTCQYHEVIDCQVKKNITITRYFTVEDCCPGYKLDPINNVTCIRSSVETSAKGTLAVPALADKTSKGLLAETSTKGWLTKESLLDSLLKSEINSPSVIGNNSLMNGMEAGSSTERLLTIESLSDSLLKSEINSISVIGNNSFMNGTENETKIVGSQPSGYDHVADDVEGPIKSPPKPPKELWGDPPVTVARVEKSSKGSVTQNGNGNNAKYQVEENDEDNDDDGNSGEDDSTSDAETSRAIDDDDDSAFLGLSDDDSAFLGLSYGAYAGIICTLLFVFCVIVLIMLRVRKRARKNLEKSKQSSEIEITQKMLNMPA